MHEIMRALVLQHVEPETCGLIGDALRAREIAIDVVAIHRGDRVPALLEHDALVVMGGPMGVYEQDRYAHLRHELALIRDAIERGRPVIGVCLGRQLVAAALGAEVRASGSQEIGWIPVTSTDASSDDPLLARVPRIITPWQWHGDVFSLPPGAVSLASSARTTHQAFRAGRAWGLLFHLEATRAIVEGMLHGFADEARAAGVDVAAAAREIAPRLDALAPLAASVFGAFADVVVTATRERSPGAPAK
jgi:GMP synthase (glutamine-hydrolysing)